MSTTVIASRFGWALSVAAWWAPSLDEDAVRRVLRDHGLELLPGQLDGNEFIAGQDLSPTRAAALAQDLRQVGLTVRVVNKTGITQSRRVGNAQARLFMATMFTLPVAFVAATGEMPEPLMLLAIPGLFAALNAVALQVRGGTTLPLAGAEPEGPQTTPASLVDTLRDQLPEHMVAPLVEQVRELERVALEDPDGPAAQELAALREDQLAHRQEEAADKAKRLRAELARARQAVRETGPR